MANWASNPKGLQVVSAGSPPDLERDEVAAECVQEHRLAGAGRCDRQHGSAPIDGEAQTVEHFFGKAGMTPQPLGWTPRSKGTVVKPKCSSSVSSVVIANSFGSAPPGR